MPAVGSGSASPSSREPSRSRGTMATGAPSAAPADAAAGAPGTTSAIASPRTAVQTGSGRKHFLWGDIRERMTAPPWRETYGIGCRTPACRFRADQAFRDVPRLGRARPAAPPILRVLADNLVKKDQKFNGKRRTV